MTTVFISYSNEDRDQALTIATCLRAMSVGVWIDQFRIPGGARYSTEIVKAIKACRVLALVASRKAFASEWVPKEVNLAMEENKKILPLHIEADLIIPDDFRLQLTGLHHVRVTDDYDGWSRRLHEALVAHGVEAQPPPESVPAQGADLWATKARTIATDVMPYLADRTEQERIIRIELGLHLDTMPQRPMVMVVHGDRSQCIDGFIQRLEQVILPKLLPSEQLDWKLLRWPRSNAPAILDASVERANVYQQELADSFELRLNATLPAIAEAIGKCRVAAAFCSTIAGELWRGDEIDTIRRVLDLWSRMPDLSRSQPVIVFLVVSYRETKQGLLRRWLGRKQRPGILGLVQALERSPPTNLGVRVLPELVDIEFDDVEHWVRKELRPADIEDILRQTRAWFTDGRSDGMRPRPYGEIAPELKKLIPSDMRRLRGL